MKKSVSLFLVLLLCALLPLTASAEGIELPCGWLYGADGSLSVYVDTTADAAPSWTVSFSESGLLDVADESFIPYDPPTEANEGSWIAALMPLPGAAGIITVTLAAFPQGSDEPTASVSLTLYLNGTGGITILMVNDIEITPLPVD